MVKEREEGKGTGRDVLILACRKSEKMEGERENMRREEREGRGQERRGREREEKGREKLQFWVHINEGRKEYRTRGEERFEVLIIRRKRGLGLGLRGGG